MRKIERKPHQLQDEFVADTLDAHFLLDGLTDFVVSDSEREFGQFARFGLVEILFEKAAKCFIQNSCTQKYVTKEEEKRNNKTFRNVILIFKRLLGRHKGEKRLHSHEL